MTWCYLQTALAVSIIYERTLCTYHNSIFVFSHFSPFEHHMLVQHKPMSRPIASARNELVWFKEAY